MSRRPDPREIVSELDRYIVGQNAAKRAVAIALRNRWRRHAARSGAARGSHAEEHPDDRADRRRQDRDRAPPRESGQRAVHQGRGDQVHRGRLRRQGRRADRARPGRRRGKMAREQAKPQVRSQAEDRAEDRILDALLPRRQSSCGSASDSRRVARQRRRAQKLRKQLREGTLDEREIEIETAVNVGVEIMAPPGMEEMDQQLRGMFSSLAGQKTQKRKLTIKAARPLLIEEEAAQMINDDELKARALHCLRAERHRLHRRDRQGRAARRMERRRRQPRRRAARPAAAGRRLDRVDQARHRPAPITSCSSPRARSRWPSRRT